MDSGGDALLSHLHAAGFHGAPRPPGLDELGREVLPFIPGHHRLARRLRPVARLIGDFHDAVIGFYPPPDARWQAFIPAEGMGIIAHHDLAPWNLVINPRHWAFIDWDGAAPGSRLWDVAYALHSFVPLGANPCYQRGNPAHRVRLFAGAYGLDQSQRQQLVPMLARRTKAMHDFLAVQAATGTQPWIRLWQQGRGRAWQADTDYIAEREDTWRHALLD